MKVLVLFSGWDRLGVAQADEVPTALRRDVESQGEDDGDRKEGQRGVEPAVLAALRVCAGGLLDLLENFGVDLGAVPLGLVGVSRKPTSGIFTGEYLQYMQD